MFNKKIVPDFTPRRAVPQKSVVYSTPLQEAVSLPSQILISESQKLPIFVPPKAPLEQASVVAHKSVSFASEPVIIFETHTTPSVPTLFSGPTQNAAPASFSPNLETFAGIDNSYFATVADLPDPSQWSLYPAISTINVNGNNVINGNTLSFSTINSFSTVCQVLDLDGNNLTTAGEELLFNGQPLASVSSVTSNVSGWSLYPAISTIICDSNAITGVTNIQLSTINGSPFRPEWVSTATSALDMSNYGITNISSLTGVSSINGSPYISSFNSEWVSTATSALDMSTFGISVSSLTGVSSINGAVYPPSSMWVSTATSALDMGPYGISVSSITGISSLNGTAFPGPVVNLADWANFPAISTVVLPDKDLKMTTNTPGLAYNTALLNANVQIGTASNAPLRPDFTAYCGSFTVGSLVSPATSVSITSLGNVAIDGGAGVSVTGGGGVAVTGGGGVAVTGVGGILVSGGGAVSINGSGGVSIVGSGAVSVAAGGVLVSGGGVAITAGGLAINAGLTEIGTSALPGGGLNVWASDLNMVPIGPATSQIYTEYLNSYSGSNTMQITGVSTINGAVYPPTAGAATAFSYNLYVSNISGSDTAGDGKISNPYKTITKAIAVAATIAETNPVIINLAAGTYTENLTINRANLYITGGSTSLSTATVINGSITIDTTVSSEFILIGGLSSVQVTNIIYNNSFPKDQNYVITDCLIVPGAGVSGILLSDSSAAGNASMTVQNCLIYMSDTLAVSITNGRISFINTQITNNPFLANSILSFIVTGGTGGVNLFGCSLVQNSTASTVQPLINIGNNAVTGTSMLINSCILQYTSATADTGTGGKCCIRLSNGTAIPNVSVINCLLICEGARTTNGSAGQYVAIQRTGVGTITFSYGQNICGATANHLPAAGAGLTKTAYIVLGN